MKFSLPIIKNSIRSLLIDRGMMLSDFLLATIAPFLIQWLIWKFVFSTGRVELEGYTYSQLMFYYACAIFLGRLNNSYDLVIGFSDSVREGSTELYCVKPMSFARFELLKFLGGGCLYVVPVLVLAVSWSVFHLRAAIGPSEVVYAVGVLVQIVLSQILCFYVGWSVAQLCFWFVRSEFLASVMTTSSAFLGGELLPPQLWPTFLQPLIKYNPFSFMVSRPAQLLVKIDFSFLLETLVLGTAYIGVFALLSHLLFNAGMKQYQSTGG